MSLFSTTRRFISMLAYTYSSRAQALLSPQHRGGGSLTHSVTISVMQRFEEV